jgi:hypothetical protein
LLKREALERNAGHIRSSKATAAQRARREARARGAGSNDKVAVEEPGHVSFGD